MPDYVVDEPEAPSGDPDDPAANIQAAYALNQWIGLNAANMPNVDSFDPAAGVPHFIRDGFRGWLNINLEALKIYQRFQVVIDSFLPSNVVAAMHVLLAALADLEILNQAGPN